MDRETSRAQELDGIDESAIPPELQEHGGEEWLLRLVRLDRERREGRRPVEVRVQQLASSVESGADQVLGQVRRRPRGARVRVKPVPKEKDSSSHPMSASFKRGRVSGPVR